MDSKNEIRSADDDGLSKQIERSEEELNCNEYGTFLKNDIVSPSTVFDNANIALPVSEEQTIERTQLHETGTTNVNELAGPSGEKAIKVKRTLKQKHKVNIKRKKHDKTNAEGEVDTILDGVEQDIDSVLEETAQKTKLTAVNVKSILRHVITNEHVLAMVWNTMNSEGSSTIPDAFYEPKLTRSKIRELRETCSNDASEAVKQLNPRKKLLEEEFPDNESSDEEYNPTAEPEEDTDEDDLNSSFVMSDFGSPGAPECLTPVVEPESTSMHSEDETRLIIEDYDHTGDSDSFYIKGMSESDKIALRTRSRLPLIDTPLEFIEAAFIAPDITVDMYDSECDDEDWKDFLNDFFKPLEATGVDDETNDPEYNFLEDDNEMADHWDLRNDRAVKVSKKELNNLVAELLEATEFGQNYEDEEEEDKTQGSGFQKSPEQTTSDESEESQCQSSYCMSSDMRAVLDEQIRQHVQLLTQMFLLSSDDPELIKHNAGYRTLLNEINHFSQKTLPFNRCSAFSAYNLPGAIELINIFEKNQESENLSKNLSNRSIKLKNIPKNIQQIIAFSPVFMYSELLPSCKLIRQSHIKVCFSQAEDQLIAYGLDQFHDLIDPKAVMLIKEHMMPVKTVQQLLIRIKNIKRMKMRENNPVGYFLTYGKIFRQTKDIPSFDQKLILPPYKQPIQNLPQWMWEFCRRKGNTNPIPIMPACLSSSSQVIQLPISPKPKLNPNRILPRPILSPIKNPSLSVIPKPRFNPILPRPGQSPVKNSSPMKQVSNILKKYGYGRRLVVKGPLNFTLSPCKKIGDEVRNKCQPIVSKPLATVRPFQLQELEEAGKIKPAESSNEINDSPCTSPVATVNTELILANNDSPFDTDTGNDCGSEIDTCEEGEEDEIVDNEGDLAALMVASSTICKKSTPMTKKKNQNQRKLESTLVLLAPDLIESDPLRDTRENTFVHSYMQKAKEILVNDPSVYEAFLLALCDFTKDHKTAVQLFKDISVILQKYPVLVEEFVPFLMPDQALLCGRIEEHSLFSKTQLFLRKLEVHFGKQPQHLQKILRTLTQLQGEERLSGENVYTAVHSLLRNQGHLLEELCQLLPDEHPTPSVLTEFEEFVLPDSDTETQDCEESFEEIFIPEQEDPYGTKQCPCKCHTRTADLRMKNRIRHCIQCGIKFIDGRIFLQMGKALKPAQVICHKKINLSHGLDNLSLLELPEAEPKIREENETKVEQSQEITLETSDRLAFISEPQVVESESEDNPIEVKGQTNWSKEEDKLLLETCQKMSATDEAFQKVSELISHRDLNDIKGRFWELLNLFSANKSDEEADSEEDTI